ncbi:MAG: diphthamide biosynthesis enzyme Dph2 [Candidatus Aenigmarchaeota archaeon]|jgi:2-(3-amino-3-carboxypropyl)histidine synthase|nr:diphthamide biosynthesis enzyme Dph2 [Candidatus Aenigmarchaeota archaeon]
MEIEEAIRKLKEMNAKRILIQLPEGLKNKSLEISDLLEKEGLEPIISLENTYGACDLRDDEALRLKCDAILHLGHNDFGFEWLKSKIPVFYVEWFSGKIGEEGLEKIERALKDFENIGVVYSIQYKKAFENIVEFLKKIGKKVFVGGSGQTIGCNFSSAISIEKYVNVFLVVSSGKFHAIGVALNVKKPVFVFDVETNDVQKIDVNKYLKIKAWNKKIFEDSKNVGLLLSWKKGQIKDFELVKKKIQSLGKRVYVLAFDELNESLLEGLNIDCLINLSCPRISVDDLERYRIPIIDCTDALS